MFPVSKFVGFRKFSICSVDINYGLFVKFEKEKSEIISLLYKYYGDLGELNESLEYHFIFGYYAEINYLFKKNESEEK